MNSKVWGSIGTAACLLTLSMSSLADTRTEWGTGTMSGATPIDDSVLMQVSARGGIDENAVKALQSNGKLNEVLAATGMTPAMLGSAATESAEKQAIQNQIRMAMGATQAVVNTTQITGVVASIAAPVAFVPVMTLPMFGLPMLPPKASNDK